MNHPRPLPAIRYVVIPRNPATHLFEVHCSIDVHAPEGQRFALPAWIPGSYLVRDFARHVVAIRAEAAGKPIPIAKIDKHTWQTAPLPPGTPLTIIAEIYAFDLSVRGAYLDECRGFFNGTSLFLWVIGQENAPCLVDLQRPAGKRFHTWRVATTLSPTKPARGASGQTGFGQYRATSYEALIDHPVEMGLFTLISFRACGVRHDVAISGKHDTDAQRLTDDLRRVCEWQIRFFGEPPPFKRYLFLVTAVGDGYGGLEHRDSTALICSRYDLPFVGMRGTPEAYATFLGLCSHEYFHAWNVKRIKPASFISYDLSRENYTSLLWAFEGFTAYYDDLALLRSGVIDSSIWLQALAKTITTVARTPGRFRQSQSESSFDAWIKFYRPDENTPNSGVSYYAKGALLALSLDLTLRIKTSGQTSLDDVMRTLWQRYGKTGIGVETDTIREVAEELAGVRLKRFFADFVDGTRELPLDRLLATFGVRLEWESTSVASVSLDAKTGAGDGGVKLVTVYEDGAAQQAGLAAGDIVVAIDGMRVTTDTLDKRLARLTAGDKITVHAFRRDELLEVALQLSPASTGNARLVFSGKHTEARRRWLGV